MIEITISEKEYYNLLLLAVSDYSNEEFKEWIKQSHEGFTVEEHTTGLIKLKSLLEQEENYEFCQIIKNRIDEYKEVSK